PVAGMVHAVVLLVVLLVAMPLASYIPMPAIAAILFMVAYNMSEWREFVSIVKHSPKSDILVLVVTFVLTIVFDLVVAICVGLVLSTLLFMKRMSDETNAYGWKEIDEATDEDNIGLKTIPEGVSVFEITGPIFFGVATKFSDAVLRADKTKKVLVLRMRSVPAIDATGIHAFETILESLDKKGIKLVVSHLNEQPLKILKKSGIYKRIGAENFCPHIDIALKRAEELVKTAENV
ncbi:MAG: STAS domain-containing protein, partial [Clostridia bacterium]|nr:STAS domain-containing protein [Clostridia bacterium]